MAPSQSALNIRRYQEALGIFHNIGPNPLPYISQAQFIRLGRNLLFPTWDIPY
jgi:hypothetical protein